MEMKASWTGIFFKFLVVMPLNLPPLCWSSYNVSMTVTGSGFDNRKSEIYSIVHTEKSVITTKSLCKTFSTNFNGISMICTSYKHKTVFTKPIC